MPERLIDKLEEYLNLAQGKTVELRDIRAYLRIEIGSKDDTNLRTQMSTTMVDKKIVSKSGRNDGRYKVIKQVKPVRWWEEVNEEPLDFKFPRGYGNDVSEFGFEDILEVFAGDMIVITGTSNFGKTTLALSILGENLGLMPAVLMGNEYTADDNKISPKFKRRMNRMTWVNWFSEEGEPRFELLPVSDDYEDHTIPDYLNVIDWISMAGEYYLIDSVMKGIKDKLRTGVAVVVLQKNPGAEFGEGGARTERYADVYMKVDSFGLESMVTLGKVKAPKTRATGRSWAFSIIDYGANLVNIREIVKCKSCWGKGWKNNKPCESCFKLGWVDK